jgi:hypothetical protein
MNNYPRPRTRPATALAPASHEDDTMNETTGGGRRRRWCRARPRRAGVLAVTAGLVLLTAACGGSPSSTRSPSSTGSGGSPNAGGSVNSQLLAYSRCVRSHGVPDFPDPDSSGQIPKEAAVRAFRGVSDARARAASNACANLYPAGQGSPTLTAREQQDYLKAAACMRSHGITSFPDPSFPDGHVDFSIPSSIDTKSQRFTQAAQTCTRLIPAGLPYSSGSGG